MLKQSRRPGESQHEHRPQPVRIMALAEQVLNGRILLPKFQREFVWTREQVVDLLDSIARNYPIGSVLLWESKKDLAGERTIADLEVGARRRRDDTVSYLLDGRQRLTSICGTLYWEPDEDPGSYWNIVYDLVDRRFLHLADLSDPPPHQIPARLLLDQFAYIKWLEPLDQDLRQVGERLYLRFFNYSVAVVTLDDMPIGEIGRVFERANTKGTPLTTVELVRAATWTETFDLLDAIDGICAVLARKHYGQIDRTLLLRSISAAAGLGFSLQDVGRIPDLPAGQLTKAVEQTEQAARRAVDFLTTQIKTPTAKALPYMNQFTVVVEIFRQVPKPDVRQYEAIRKWFWRTVLSGYFSGWNRGQMQADLAAVEDFAAGRTKDIEVTVTLPGAVVWLRTPYRRDSAMTKTMALMLAYAEPVDLMTGSKIDVGKALAWSNEMEYHHFFPQAWLGNEGLPGERANVLANIIMLTSLSNKRIADQRPSGYLQIEVDFSTEPEIRRRLVTSMVSPTAFDAAMADDYDGFLAARAETLVQWSADLADGTAPDSLVPPQPDLEAPFDGEPVDEDTTD
ncbi:MAG TPA: DUF262 domain-containing protein [Streptosporangiaceae bacterium]|nr:DUF262 domain-containing protein [Streptosporangiaceae bacterium]